MAFYKMSQSEELGDSVTHFFKTGGVLRNRDDDLVRIREMLPLEGENNTRVEYDIWYDMDDPARIHGYVYTDTMGKFIYLRVADAKRSHEAMERASNSEVTQEGFDIMHDLASTSFDKYRLRKTNEAYDKVVFLAGANILHKAVDWGKLDRMVSEGWRLKCHPLTSRDLRQLLINRFGYEAVLDRKTSGYDLLEKASHVACAENSEMGIVAVAKGKELVSVGCGNTQLTYSAIYAQLNESKDKKKTLLKILSCKESGLVPSHIAYPQERITLFFDQYRDIPHVKPKSYNN